MAPALTDVQWQPFHQDALLVFSGGGGKIVRLRLFGVHFFATRQSLLGGPNYSYPEERNVEFFGIFDDSDFLKQFTNGEIRFCGGIVLYDMQNRLAGSATFVKPLHVNVVCPDGILDVICEQVERA